MTDPYFPNTLFPDAYFDRGYELASTDFGLTEKYNTEVVVKDSAISFALDIWPDDKEDADGKITPRMMAFVMSLMDGYKAHKLVKRAFDKEATKERLKKESYHKVEDMLEKAKILYEESQKD
jgi:hypothetical protein